jgi:hypothetical protein
LPLLPALTSPEYTAAFNLTKDLGALELKAALETIPDSDAKTAGIMVGQGHRLSFKEVGQAAEHFHLCFLHDIRGVHACPNPWIQP